MNRNLESASTEYVEAYRTRFAYRRLGGDLGTPLVFLQHFTGSMDDWDPIVVDALAGERPVIVFDNAGVGSSSGITPDNVEQMALDAESFIVALGLDEIDLLGFSLGGFIAQLIASRTAVQVRKLVLVGTAPRGGEENLLRVVAEATEQDAPDVRLPLFFTKSRASQAAGASFVRRATARAHDRAPDGGEEVATPQAAAIIAWCADAEVDEKLLGSVRQPALVVHGSDDTMFPSMNAYRMFKAMPDATLIIYPDAGHGALFQYPDTFVAHVTTFLDR